jgi:hypothetical protein
MREEVRAEKLHIGIIVLIGRLSQQRNDESCAGPGWPFL